MGQEKDIVPGGRSGGSMNIEEWSEDLCTGVRWQDYQHEGLLSAIRDLASMIERDAAAEQFAATIRYLHTYIEHHFGLEELYMKELNYKERDAHLRAHDLFIHMTEDLAQADRGSPGDIVPIQLCYNLNRWILDHIGGIDRKLGAFLIDHGVR